MNLHDDGVPLSYDQLSTGLEALALLEPCSPQSMLALGGMTALAYRRGRISVDQLRTLAQRMAFIRDEKQCRCAPDAHRPGCPACRPARLN